MRNAEKDLALCEAATPGTWIAGHYGSVNTKDGWKLCNMQPEGNADFIAAAREALPYWINRAENLQKEVAAWEEEAAALPEDVSIPEFVSELNRKVEKLEKALGLACVHIVETTDECPLTAHNTPCGPGCTDENDSFVACWEKYFLEEADHDAP